MPIHLWTLDGNDEWLALDRSLQVIDRGVDLAELRKRHGDRRLTFVLVRTGSK